MPSITKVAVDYDALVSDVAATLASRGLPTLSTPILRVLVTAASISSLHFVDEGNEALMLAAFQMQNLSARVLMDLGIEKAYFSSIFDVVDEVFAALYTKMVDEVERLTPKTGTTIQES
jgi:hypothetical protein